MDNKPPSDLNFHSKLKDPKSLSIRNDIKEFILTVFRLIEQTKTKEDLRKDYQTFITHLISSFCSLWKIKITYQSDPLYHEISDNFECLLTKQLYTKYSYLIYNDIFCSTRKEKESDFIFDRLLDKYQFVTPAMLEISESVINDIYLTTAINSNRPSLTRLIIELATINQFKSPKDKMMTFINVVGILSFMYSKFSNKETSPGAEEILPLVIYTVIKGRIPKLKSNLTYYRQFRYEPRIAFVEDYYLNTFNAVIDFIEKMGPSDLLISEEDYNKEISKYEEKQKEKLITPMAPLPGKNSAISYVIVDHNEELLLKYFNNEIAESSLTKEQTPIAMGVNTEKDKLIAQSHLFNVNLDNLYEKYFVKDEDDYTPSQYLQLIDDFKILLKLIDSFLQKSKQKE